MQVIIVVSWKIGLVFRDNLETWQVMLYARGKVLKVFVFICKCLYLQKFSGNVFDVQPKQGHIGLKETVHDGCKS